MNVAILIQTLGGGGAERVAQIIGNYYVDRGDTVYYFIGKTSIRQAYQVKGKIVPTGIKSSLSNNIFGDAQALGKLFLASCKIRNLKKKYKIDVAISFMEEFNYLNILSKGRERVITRICTILSQEGEWVSLYQRKDLVHFFYPKADRVVVMSDYAREDMHNNFGIPRAKMVKIPNPVLKVDRYAEDVGWEYGHRVIVTVGRLAAEKQQERIIRAFSYVVAREKDACLLILGVGPKEGYLKNLTRKLKLEKNIVLQGTIQDLWCLINGQWMKVFRLARKKN